MDTEGIADAQGTVTGPDGVVHAVQRHTRYLTVCGKSCAGWSRGLTQIQQMGLVSFCPDCEHQDRRTSVDTIVSENIDLTERNLRAHLRKIADEQLMDREGWRTGTCSGCRTEHELVKGPAEQQLCKYCDELRIMPPPLRKIRAISTHRPHHTRAEKRLARLSALFGIAGLVLMFIGGHETSSLALLFYSAMCMLLAVTWEPRK